MHCSLQNSRFYTFPAKSLPCMQDKEALHLWTGMLPLTLFSPHAVPSTAASSLEWHVVPTVHHSVLQTLCRKHICTGRGYCTDQRTGTDLTHRERVAPCKAPATKPPWSCPSSCNIGRDHSLRPCRHRRWSRHRTAGDTDGPRRRGRPGAPGGSPAPPGQGGHPGTAPSPG